MAQGKVSGSVDGSSMTAVPSFCVVRLFVRVCGIALSLVCPQTGVLNSCSDLSLESSFFSGFSFGHLFWLWLKMPDLWSQNKTQC